MSKSLQVVCWGRATIICLLQHTGRHTNPDWHAWH